MVHPELFHTVKQNGLGWQRTYRLGATYSTMEPTPWRDPASSSESESASFLVHQKVHEGANIHR